ncbi:TetR/AcrR family transcriptional regulator [Yinghuangia sp. ASG 101]|uniref:TetR/AcrR family transcriptional regulator n=1 Tax=Yinghuangia sp. ASG 101 TaxID=2896848 RepID=UPI001E5185A7|nr:TetR/AcrR family transcriptional regulator C-terminal domain-containing protein [Yinghuangia sp. ASG 101]UGQ13328.1 TetR/AcrR family transcriptional regulator [Yinghuangia sp. ASG 101]
MGRPRQPLLSRDRIVAAALALVDAEGLDAVSTRRLATELGVSGPALYNHFATKDELIDAVVDSVLGEVDVDVLRAPRPSDAGAWQEPVAAWARSYRAALAAHPNVVPALAPGPGRRPNALRMADAVFGLLVASGWPRAQATRIGVLMRYFVTGSALGSFAGGFPDDAKLYAGAYPHLDQAHLLADAQREINEAAFETGLAALLDGLTRRYEGLGAGPR